MSDIRSFDRIVDAVHSNNILLPTGIRKVMMIMNSTLAVLFMYNKYQVKNKIYYYALRLSHFKSNTISVPILLKVKTKVFF